MQVSPQITLPAPWYRQKSNHDERPRILQTSNRRHKQPKVPERVTEVALLDCVMPKSDIVAAHVEGLQTRQKSFGVWRESFVRGSVVEQFRSHSIGWDGQGELQCGEDIRWCVEEYGVQDVHRVQSHKKGQDADDTLLRW